MARIRPRWLMATMRVCSGCGRRQSVPGNETIRTKKDLSPYPVRVLTINGQAPLNVVKTRHGSDYDYRYSFRTNNLKRDISSQIK